MCMKHEEVGSDDWFQDMVRDGYRSMIARNRQRFRIELLDVEDEEVITYHYIDGEMFGHYLLRRVNIDL